MNYVNKITLSRILIIPIFILGIDFESVSWRIIALISFGYVSFSDWLDGYLARKHNMVTDFGKFMDPLADKIFICSAFISFLQIPELKIPSWMIIIIISREFMITGLRTIAVSKGVVLPATKSGKFKTTSQLIAIFIIVALLLIESLKTANIVNLDHRYFIHLPVVCIGLVTFFTFISGYQYLSENWHLFIEKSEISHNS
ncbi:CDP-diacylglycerol--glycerol-3-phosphate 3-phosphatidyltransferase [bacterium]